MININKLQSLAQSLITNVACLLSHAWRWIVKNERKIFLFVCAACFLGPGIYVALKFCIKIVSSIGCSYLRFERIYFVFLNVSVSVLFFFIGIFFYSRIFWIILFLAIVPWSVLMILWANDVKGGI